MDFYIYGFIVLFVIIFWFICDLFLTKPEKIDVKHVYIKNRGGGTNIGGMRLNLSKKHKKRVF